MIDVMTKFIQHLIAKLFTSSSTTTTTRCTITTSASASATSSDENNKNTHENENDNKNNQNNDLVWYFSYGSNMNPSVFEQKRHITPLATRICYVPDYVLTYGEGALPYLESAFCTCIPRSQFNDLEEESKAKAKVKAAKVERDRDRDNSYHHHPEAEQHQEQEQRRRRPDIHGVAFLITQQQYERVLLTEGGWGWQAYRHHPVWNIGHYGVAEVECMEIASAITASTSTASTSTSTTNSTSTDSTSINTNTVSSNHRQKFKAYTLVGLLGSDGTKQRYDCNASQRYYNIVIEGAKSSGLPHLYQDYLKECHPPYNHSLQPQPNQNNRNTNTTFFALFVARNIMLVFYFPSILLEMGTLFVCWKWNNYITNSSRTSINKRNIDDDDEDDERNMDRQFTCTSGSLVLRRSPWLIGKVLYFYRFLVLETILTTILEDWCHIPNGFKNQHNSNHNDNHTNTNPTDSNSIRSAMRNHSNSQSNSSNDSNTNTNTNTRATIGGQGHFRDNVLKLQWSNNAVPVLPPLPSVSPAPHQVQSPVCA